MTEQIKLEPCAHCGAPARMKRKGRATWVECTDCGIHGVATWDEAFNAAAWNRRALSDDAADSDEGVTLPREWKNYFDSLLQKNASMRDERETWKARAVKEAQKVMGLVEALKQIEGQAVSAYMAQDANELMEMMDRIHDWTKAALAAPQIQRRLDDGKARD